MFEKRDLRALGLMFDPVWVFDLERGHMWWANAAALALFAADTLDELQARQHGDGMSAGMRRRLDAYRRQFLVDETVNEQWTFYPDGQPPVPAQCRCSGITIRDADGERLAMLVQAQTDTATANGNERRLLEAVRHCNERISLYGLDGQTLMRNPAAVEAFGPIQPSENADAFENSFEDESDAERARQAATQEGVFRERVATRTERGTAWHDTEVRRIHDPVTGEPAWLAVQHDVSAQHATEHSLEQARREADALRKRAEEASGAKSAFLATMSHELRTPMTGVLAAAELLDKTPLTPDQAEALEMVLEGGRQMVTLVDDVLDISRIEAGHVDLMLEPVIPEKLVVETLRPLQGAAQRKGLTLRHRVDGALPASMALDKKRVRQVLNNLTANAIKFTDEGCVTVTLRQQPGETGPAWLRIEVEDDGIGVDPETAEQLFAAFTQGDTSASRRHGGAGLGLHIARSLVEAQGGRIGVQSRAKGGSTFWFELPVQHAEVPKSTPRANFDAPTLTTRVLLVDDNHLSRHAIQRLLQRWGCTVVEASDGHEALRRVDVGTDLVLMDINMPGLDGPTTAQAIRETPSLAHVPIVALTADVFFRNREGLFDLVLTKPVDWDALRNTLINPSGRARP